MAAAGSTFLTPSDRPPLEGSEAGPIVVWLWGEHDASTDKALCLTLARAIAADSAGLIIDLSEVDFIGPSTLGVLVRACKFLGQRSASFTVRSASAAVRDIIDACGLTDLFSLNAATAGTVREAALSSWVVVPAAAPAEGPRAPSPPVTVPAHLGRASA